MSLPLLAPLAGVAAGIAAGAFGGKFVQEVAGDGRDFLKSLLNGGGAATDGGAERPTATTATAEKSLDADSPGIDDLKKRTQSLLEQFQRTLSRRLQTIGVDLSQPVRLEESLFGDVASDGSHPDRQAIDQLFYDDPTLAAAFRELGAHLSALRRAEQSAAGAADDKTRLAITLLGDQIDVDFSGDGR